MSSPGGRRAFKSSFPFRESRRRSYPCRRESEVFPHLKLLDAGTPRIEVAAARWNDASGVAGARVAERRLLGSLRRPSDGYLARFDRVLSVALSRALVRTAITPNVITALSLLVGLAGAVLLANTTVWMAELGSLLLWASAIFDGCDGEVARLRLLTSAFGRRIDLNAVKVSLLHVGWGMALVLSQEVVAHALNGCAWRFAFTPESARRVSLGELIRLRVAGDAINYLTPTATIGGEVARTMLLSDACGGEARAVSVVTAKATQTLAQAFFITAGLIFIAKEWVGLATARWALAGAGVGLAAVMVVARRLEARGGGRGAAWRRV